MKPASSKLRQTMIAKCLSNRPTTARTAGLGAVLALAISGCQPSGPDSSEAPRKKEASKESVQKTTQPPLNPAGDAPELTMQARSSALPEFAAIKVTAEKKSAFFNYLRPMIAAENALIGSWKAYLNLLDAQLQKQQPLHPQDLRWLQTLADKHRLAEKDPAQQLLLLLKMVGEIPEALVLAQGANESAWGTSRFARKGNNLFGMWCFNPGCGITPLNRPAGSSYEVRSFDTVAAGVHHYFTNLNANKSYHQLRGIRRCLDANQYPLSGRALAAGLTGYSARGGHYVDELRALMRVNKLEDWEQNWWGSQSPKHPCYQLVQVSTDKPDPIVVAKAASPGNNKSATAAAQPLPSEQPGNPTAAESAAETAPPAKTETAPTETSQSPAPAAQPSTGEKTEPAVSTRAATVDKHTEPTTPEQNLQTQAVRVTTEAEELSNTVAGAKQMTVISTAVNRPSVPGVENPQETSTAVQGNPIENTVSEPPPGATAQSAPAAESDSH